MHKINHANIKEWAANYQGEPFDAILCDPPYELGFMGKSWDSSGIAFDKDMWADLLRILKPGGHLLAFSGSRTYHRMACAIEDAGFEIRDMIEWVYGSGFPKSLNIGKAVDKIQGNEREVTGQSRNGSNSLMGGLSDTTTTTIQDITKGTSPYEGYGTALKPAHEPCVLARKPLEGTVANNALKYGTGGLNIDGSRVASVEENRRTAGGFASKSDIFNNDEKYKINTMETNRPLGRFPANLIHDGSDEVVGLFPNSKSTQGINVKRKDTPNIAMSGRNYARTTEIEGYSDSGSAARFFYTAKPDYNPELIDFMYKSGVFTDDDIADITGYPSMMYTAKASKSERNAGLEGFEVKDPDNRSDTAKGSYTSKGIAPQTNHHPTVKPLSLTKYLANLIKPPTGGRLLVPFSGSGSEMIGALQAGWDYVEGVELTEEYIPIAEARIKYWTNISHTSSKPKVSAKKNGDLQKQPESLTLF